MNQQIGVVKKKRKELTLMQFMLALFFTGLFLQFVLSFAGTLF
jgi:hypothetical protein